MTGEGQRADAHPRDLAGRAEQRAVNVAGMRTRPNNVVWPTEHGIAG